ncbi:MAG: metallophosphoesterase [Cyanobium sp.]
MTLPSSPPFAPPVAGQRHWVIGDVHGCALSLDALLQRLPAGDRLIFCGDVINRGARILEAMERVWALVESGRAVWLRGNHEQALLQDLGADSFAAWRNLAGCDTYRQLGERCCRGWQERLSSLPTAYWGSGWVATHAGFDPISWQPHLSIRHAFWQAYDGRFGDVVVGHTPGEQVRRVGRGGRIVLIDTGACYGGVLTAYCPETTATVQVEGLHPAAPAILPPHLTTIG